MLTVIKRQDQSLSVNASDSLVMCVSSVYYEWHITNKKYRHEMILATVSIQLLFRVVRFSLAQCMYLM